MDSDSYTSSEQAYRSLKLAILDMEMKPGERIPTQQLAEKLKVSRTPIREALGRLEQEGLVVRLGGWGYAVRQMTFKEVMDLYRVRETLELQAVREAIPHIAAPTMKVLEAHLAKAQIEAKKKGAGRYRVFLRQFYRAIAESSDNGFLLAMLGLIDDRIRWLGAQIADRHADRPRESLDDAHAVLNALKKQDCAAAETAVRRHVISSRDRFIEACGARSEIVVM